MYVSRSLHYESLCSHCPILSHPQCWKGSHFLCLVLAVPHKILLVFSSIAVLLGMSVKRTSWKCWGTLYLELGQCTVLTCWIVCRIDSSGNLWILKAWHPLLEPQGSSPGEACQLHWGLATIDMESWAKVLAPDSWIYFTLISKQGEFWTFSKVKKNLKILEFKIDCLLSLLENWQ